MRQHRDATTTEDIAAVEEHRGTGPLDTDPADTDQVDADRVDADPIDSERTDADRVESERADRIEPERVEPERVESERFDSGPVTVDETARPADTTATGHAAPRASEDSAADVLFDEAEAERFRARWREVQTAFVDDPKQAVRDADVLVAELMRELASAFSERKRVLEDQWREGTDAETEDLRLALRGYRSFVDQLLAH
jgi:hypothetical protein